MPVCPNRNKLKDTVIWIENQRGKHDLPAPNETPDARVLLLQQAQKHCNLNG